LELSITKNTQSPLLLLSIQSTGFSLLIDLIKEIKDLPPQQALNNVIIFISYQLNLQYLFDVLSLGNELRFNGEFQLLVGGPKWVDKKFTNDVFVRKHVAVKDKGDFLLVARYPKELLTISFPLMI
jgi:hypothetical protein